MLLGSTPVHAKIILTGCTPVAKDSQRDVICRAAVAIINPAINTVLSTVVNLAVALAGHHISNGIIQFSKEEKKR